LNHVNVLRSCHPLTIQRKCHHEGDGDIEQEGTNKVDGIKSSRTARMTAEEAAGLLGLSFRHVRRLLRAYRNEGAQVLAHGNRGRKPANALGDGLKRQVVGLAQSTYAGCNTQHLSELLAEREGIIISRSAARLALLRARLKSPRRRRTPKYRSQRNTILRKEDSYKISL
jgi:transposase